MNYVTLAGYSGGVSLPLERKNVHPVHPARHALHIFVFSRILCSEQAVKGLRMCREGGEEITQTAGFIHHRKSEPIYVKPCRPCTLSYFIFCLLERTFLKTIAPHQRSYEIPDLMSPLSPGLIFLTVFLYTHFRWHCLYK